MLRPHLARIANLAAVMLVTATLAGCGILLLAAVWWTIAQDSSQTSPRSGLWRGLCTIGFATFLLGVGWQLVGYVKFGALSW